MTTTGLAPGHTHITRTPKSIHPRKRERTDGPEAKRRRERIHLRAGRELFVGYPFKGFGGRSALSRSTLLAIRPILSGIETAARRHVGQGVGGPV
jgi:hypothetical protein